MNHSAEYTKMKSDFIKQWLIEKEVKAHRNFSALVLYEQQQKDDFLRSSAYLQYLAKQDSFRTIYLCDFNVPRIMEVVDLLIEHNLVPENFDRKHCEYEMKEHLGCSASCWRIISIMIKQRIENQFEFERLQNIINIMVGAEIDFDPENCLSIDGGLTHDFYVYKKNPCEVIMPFCGFAFLPTILSFFIQNGVTNFHTSIEFTCENIIHRYLHRKENETYVLQTLQLLNDFGVKLWFGKPDYPHAYGWSNELGLCYQAEQFVQEQDRRPLSLQKLSRLSIRRSVGGIRFQERVRALPLPATMKQFVIGL